MGKLENHQSASSTKMLLIGDSGAGKTGALASLAAAGFNLRIIDVDSGLDVLANLLRDPKSQYGKEALSRVQYKTITDPMKAVGGKLIPAKATVWQRVIKTLDGAEDWDGEKLGGIVTWGSEDVLVIDSLTMLSNAALNFVLSMNARLGQQPHQSDWYTGQQMIESLLQMIYDENVKCNIILICHIAYIGKEHDMHGYPASLGQALPPKIGRYFNSTLMAKTTGQGSNMKRKILTNTSGIVELKNTAPTQVKAEYDLATGLAEYFKAVRSAAVVPSPVPIIDTKI